MNADTSGLTVAGHIGTWHTIDQALARPFRLSPLPSRHTGTLCPGNDAPVRRSSCEAGRRAARPRSGLFLVRTLFLPQSQRPAAHHSRRTTPDCGCLPRHGTGCGTPFRRLRASLSLVIPLDHTARCILPGRTQRRCMQVAVRLQACVQCYCKLVCSVTAKLFAAALQPVCSSSATCLQQLCSLCAAAVQPGCSGVVACSLSRPRRQLCRLSPGVVLL